MAIVSIEDNFETLNERGETPIGFKNLYCAYSRFRSVSLLKRSALIRSQTDASVNVSSGGYIHQAFIRVHRTCMLNLTLFS